MFYKKSSWTSHSECDIPRTNATRRLCGDSKTCFYQEVYFNPLAQHGAEALLTGRIPTAGGGPPSQKAAVPGQVQRLRKRYCSYGDQALGARVRSPCFQLQSQRVREVKQAVSRSTLACTSTL